MTSQRRTIYIVEDNPIYAEMICNYLSFKHPSFSFRRFATGEELLDNIDIPPGIVILDYHLDGNVVNAANGDTILKNLKEYLPETQVIMITSSEDISVAAMALNAGAYAFLLKDEALLQNLDEMIYL